MEGIDRRIEELLAEIHRSEVYRVYRQEEERLRQDPELCRMVDEFRSKNFRLLAEADADTDMLFEVTEHLTQESAELRRNTEVNAYLDAELALCKLMQQIFHRIADGIDMHLPEL